MTIGDVNDISPIRATLFRFSIFTTLKANQRSMFSFKVNKRAHSLLPLYLKLQPS